MLLKFLELISIWYYYVYFINSGMEINIFSFLSLLKKNIEKIYIMFKTEE